MIARVEAALRGETHNTGVLTLPAGSDVLTLAHPLMGAEKVVLLSPLDAGAAALGWWVDETSIVKGSVDLHFTSAPAGDCGFNFVIIGTKRLYS